MDEKEEKKTSQPKVEKKSEPKAEKIDYKEKYLYTLAELSNLSKRFDKEKMEMAKYYTQDFMLELLPLFDIFSMVIGNKNVAPEVAAYLKGFELVYAQFEQFFEKNGVKEIPTKLNEEYDPTKHNAIETEEVEKGENKIIQIYQKGYMMGDRILRPTTVKITTKKLAEPKEEK